MNKINPNSTYTIQQVSELTNLSKQVIRKWETRYNIIHPKRLENGYRIYSYQEVCILLQIVNLINSGKTLKQAMHQIKAETSFQQSMLLPQGTNEKKRKEYIEELLELLISNGEIGNDTNILHILQQAHHTLDLTTFLDELIIPYLRKVGELWFAGEWGEYQEALSSQVIHDFLVTLRREHQVNVDAPLVLGSCLPNERHDIPMQIILLKAMLLGFRTTMLGASPAPTAIQSTVKLLHPQKVILSGMTAKPFEDNFYVLKKLDQFAGLHPKIQFYLGGPGAIQALKTEKLQHIILIKEINSIFKT